MKAKLAALVIILAIATVVRADEQSEDYARFEKWLHRVEVLAPRYGLKLNGDEADAEFFYLYCWQSDNHSISHAILKAKKHWRE